jgi:hypothetical protein
MASQRCFLGHLDQSQRSFSPHTPRHKRGETMTAQSTQTLRLHRALYMQQAIKQAATEFADFASFAIARDGEHYAVTLSEIDPDADGDVAAEFANFALFYTAQRKRKTAV